jgi:transposase
MRSSAQALDGVGYDGGKKVKGRKLHGLVDAMGMLLGVVVHGADIQDRDGASLVLQATADRFPLLSTIYADGGYGGPRAAAGCPVDRVVVKRAEPGFVVLAKRWIVERTFAWLSSNRRLSKDYEGYARTVLAFVHIAMIRLMLRRILPIMRLLVQPLMLADVAQEKVGLTR